jgi:predicted nucleic acid-binding protein
VGTRSPREKETGDRGVSGGVTFDTGAFISVEHRRERARKLFERLRERDVLITAPLPVIGEWWRGRTDWREKILASVKVESLTLDMVKLAGEALAGVSVVRKGRGPSIVDAIVMASAASRGDVVYSSDIDDLGRLQSFFPGVRVLSI